MLSEVQAPLKISWPQLKVTNGGEAVGVPAVLPLGTSIMSSRAAVESRTVLPYGGNVWSNSSDSSIWRGWPPPNSGGANDLPVTSLYFHSFVLETEYSVGLK